MVNNPKVSGKSGNTAKKTSVTKLLRQGIKTTFTNHLRTLGFEQEKVKDHGKLSFFFRRILADRHDLVDVQFDKHHLPEFVINFSSVSSTGIVDGYGRTIPASDVRFTSTLAEYGRLYRNRYLFIGKWFRVSNIQIYLFGLETAVNNEINFAIFRFQQLDEWFNKGVVGSSIIMMKDPHNEPGAIKRFMMENGTWPPEGWNEDEV